MIILILKIIRWIKGYVVFEIIGRFPERFINLSVHQGKFVFSATPYTDKFTAALLLSDYRDIRRTARKSFVRLRVLERHGLPFFISKYKSRAGIFIGAVLFIIIVMLMQNFVWNIEINGVTTISESEFCEVLREEGLYCGTFKPKTDLPFLQRNVMHKIDEIGWMSVNIIGTKAEVEIKEKELKPHILESDTPCNIKADSDGIILSMNTKYGKAVTSPGSAVIEGSLLVSGVLENPSGAVSLVHADAEVIAQTQRVHRFTVNKTGEIRLPSESIRRYKISLFSLELPLTFESVKNDCTSRIERENIVLNNTSMPFGLITEHCTTFESASFEINRKKAENILYIDDYLCRLFTLSECQQLTAEVNLLESPSEFSADILYECKEDIATEENIIVN